MTSTNTCRCWDNLKAQYKSMRAKETQNRLKTGGGPADLAPRDALLERVGAIVPFLDLTVYIQ